MLYSDYPLTKTFSFPFNGMHSPPLNLFILYRGGVFKKIKTVTLYTFMMKLIERIKNDPHSIIMIGSIVYGLIALVLYTLRFCGYDINLLYPISFTVVQIVLLFLYRIVKN